MSITANGARPSQRPYDAIVVGGGPAGSVAAIGLAGLGWRVAVIEHRSPGEGKACGHCLAGRGAAILRRMGLGAVLDEHAVGRTDRVRFRFARSRSHETCINISGVASDNPDGLIIRRDRLDWALLERASQLGIEVRTRARVTRCRGRTVDVRLNNGTHERIEARCLVVLAHGLRSNGEWKSAGAIRSGRGFGFSFDLDALSDRRLESIAAGEIVMLLDRSGYLGMVREANGCIHLGGFVRDATDRAWLSCFLERIHERYMDDVPEIRVRDFARSDLSIHASGPMPRRASPVAGDTLARVGDATAYAEPLTGEGMTWAFESAALLVDVLRGCDGCWNAIAAQRYDHAWRRMFGARLRRASLAGMLAAQAAKNGWSLGLARIARPWVNRLAREMNRPHDDIHLLMPAAAEGTL